jgi:ABC-type dipeptide/oligopeptide/nickel transport system permease component
MDLLNNLPALIFVVLVAAFLIYTGFRLGLAFLVRRVAGLIFVLFGASFITFILGYFSPDDAVTSQCGNKCTAAQREALKLVYGLNLPVLQQYYNYVVRLLHFDLGESWLDSTKPVWTILANQVPISLQLGLSAALIAVTVGVTLGLIAAVRSNSRTDTTIQSAGLFLYAIPTFVAIPLYQLGMIYLFKAGIPNLPVSSTEWTTDLSERIAPIAIFALVQVAFYIRITRTSMLEVLRQDYVRTARAKGLSERTVLWRHVFRNGMIPIVTAIGPALAYLVNGAFITERLFNIPGIGSTTLESITAGDVPVVQATVILLAVSVALMNLVTDVVYGLIDPRIKSV